MTTPIAPALEYLMLVEESAYGTPVASPVKGTSLFYIRLTDSNSFSMIDDPIIETNPFGGGLAIDADAYSDHSECKGSLSTLLYPSQASFLFNWALTRINAGLTTPWVTTDGFTGDLASCSAYHAFLSSDGTWKRERWSGTKVSGLTLSTSRDDAKVKLKLDLQAQKPVGNAHDSSSDPDATEFPFPADADLPVGPFMFGHTSGQLSAGGVTRTQYESLSISIQNAFDPHWYESYYLSTCRAKGRKSTLDADLLLKATPDDRSAYRALTAQALSVAFANGSHTLTLNFQGNNHISKLPRDLPLGKEFMAKLSLANKWDSTAGLDLAWTYS